VPDYLSVADVVEMHARLIDAFGGSHGLRDPGALEAALFRPRTGYYSDVVAEAAALLESLAMNHPVVDGNKRIAFATADVYLRLNGYRIVGAPADLHRELMGFFASRTFDFAHLEPWLRTRTRAHP
jgi:death-on-curing protein